ncbi:hypothetical protein OsccyDRAFT_0601 [Leptolyngbyaceae cyanobacterium JSC-12]|nr:hypothetical protein OsccyDRAFT_0601 [Leptolyngbyaceae cyanobacterium JSC-12]
MLKTNLPVTVVVKSGILRYNFTLCQAWTDDWNGSIPSWFPAEQIGLNNYFYDTAKYCTDRVLLLLRGVRFFVVHNRYIVVRPEEVEKNLGRVFYTGSQRG